MAFEDRLNGLRDYIAAAVVTAWPGVTVLVESPEVEHAAPCAWVKAGPTSLEPETFTADVATVSYMVHGKWASPITQEEKTGLVTGLRAELLSDHTGGGNCYLPMVSEFTAFSEDDVLDPRKEIGVLFVAKVLAERN